MTLSIPSGARSRRSGGVARSGVRAIRSATTLDALAALAEVGYVGRDPAAKMGESYRFLRVLEHRIQLYRLRRTHLVPTDEADLRRGAGPE